MQVIRVKIRSAALIHPPVLQLLRLFSSGYELLVQQRFIILLACKEGFVGFVWFAANFLFRRNAESPWSLGKEKWIYMHSSHPNNIIDLNHAKWYLYVTKKSLHVSLPDKNTLPKVQRTRGLSSYHKFKHKSQSIFIFRILTKHQLQNINQTLASP